MFLSIEVTDFQLFNPPKYISDYEIEAYKSQKKEVLNDLKRYLLVDGNSLDGDKIQQNLFPDDEIDIFLSHSHGDADQVIKLAILLEKKGFKVFVDSCVWGNSLDLLKVIDRKYCRNDDNSAYNYDKRNYSTSHVHMMLNTALHKMIDRCELFLFLGTPNSVSVKNGIENQKSLKSPWIYSELSFLKHVRKKTKFNISIESIDENLKINETIAKDQLNVEYKKPELDYKISTLSLQRWLLADNQEISMEYQYLYKKLEKV
jgi:hypothetical protein